MSFFEEVLVIHIASGTAQAMKVAKAFICLQAVNPAWHFAGTSTLPIHCTIVTMPTAGEFPRSPAGTIVQMVT